MLTHQEHTARAMLLGRVYDWRDGTYCRIDRSGSYDTDSMLCCVTMEPIDLHTSTKRRDGANLMDDDAWGCAKENTPWGVMP